MTDATAAPEPALLTMIARELVQELYTLEQILQRYDLDQAYFDAQIAPNGFFQRVLADYTKEWQSIPNTQKRLAFSALVALEEHLPVLANRMGSRQSELADAVATAKLFRELAGIAAPASQPGAGSSTPFSISINFGDRKVALETQLRSAPAIDSEALGIPAPVHGPVHESVEANPDRTTERLPDVQKPKD